MFVVLIPRTRGVMAPSFFWLHGRFLILTPQEQSFGSS